MDLLSLGMGIGVVGKLLLGIAVLRVHAHILREHRIDRAVLASLRVEQIVTVLGLVLIVIGYVMELMFFGYLPALCNFFTICIP